ncbi:MAG: helix-turn-helix domain-containing protein, partial [Lentisphaeria bacterium]
MKTSLNFVGENIRTLRRKAGFTLSELAEKIDIKDGPLGRIERGLNAPSAKVIFNLSKVLNVSTDSLFAPTHQKLQKIREQ